MAVWYLDNDDEITDAVARLRATSDEHVVFVVPPGSRIATGRINFKLLAREAGSRDLSMAIASPDEQVRALATSAGVLTTSTAEEATAALARGDEPPTATDAVAPEVDTPDQRGEAAAVATGPTLGWSARRLAATSAVVLTVVLVAVLWAWQTLPTAKITLTPHAVAVGPIETSITALPDVVEPDVETGRIPAVVVPIPLSIERTFRATGVETIASAATGEVIFSSADTFQDIAAGTRVMTPAGVEFRTTELVTLGPPAAGQTVGMVTAPVVAVEPGEEGNVEARAIGVVPSLEDQGISVTNPEPTSGGRLEQTPRVTPADYDAAAADIQNRLAGALAAYLRDPANVPAGLTLFPDTAEPGPVSHPSGSDRVIGSGDAEFTLRGSLAATVLGVDASLVEQVGRARLAAAVPQDLVLLADRVHIDVGPGKADGQRIGFDSVARGEAALPVDAEAMTARIAGLPISEARAILEPIGQAIVTVWPEFLGDLPGDTGRITLDVREPSTTE
jgi:hypothetical protein